MSDPLALLPFALAAAGGRLDAFEAAPLVAAGVTLLQRAAPLVRALDGRRSAVLLPPSPGMLVALAASVGRAALVIDPLASRADIREQLAASSVGAVFTCERYRTRVPTDLPLVLLDDAPRSARVFDRPGDRVITVDLGSHHGLSLEGSRDVAGSEEECLRVVASERPGAPVSLSHRVLLDDARRAARAWGVTPLDRLVVLLPFRSLRQRATAEAAVLLMGGCVVSPPRWRTNELVGFLERARATVLVANGETFAALARRRHRHTAFSTVRLAMSVGEAESPDLRDQFANASGIAVTPFSDGPSPTV